MTIGKQMAEAHRFLDRRQITFRISAGDVVLLAIVGTIEFGRSRGWWP